MVLLFSGLFALLCFCTISSATESSTFGFDDIKFWVGEGSNRAMLVIEWSAAPPLKKTTLGWGYRWDGEATGEEMLKAVAKADERLFVKFQSWSIGTTVYGMGYDLDGDGFTYVPATTNDSGGSNEDGHAGDADDLYAEGWYKSDFWAYFVGETLAEWVFANTGMKERVLQNGYCDGWKPNQLGEDGGLPNENTPPDFDNLKAATFSSPFAFEVVESSGSFGPGAYGDPQAVLGKPATKVKSGSVVNSVKMVQPAWAKGENGENLITTVTPGDAITVKFDHKVLDNPKNPYGLDFIVFGNSFFSSKGLTISDETDMNQLVLGSGGWLGEEIKVSVSQDGENWYTYENGPYADGLFPTQAYKWDADNRSWTNTEMDWTRPVDPSLTETSFDGKTGDEAIEMYKGSAGGTGFDLKPSGFSWIQYIKVEGKSGTAGNEGGEVDAFSDVAAVEDSSLWLTEDTPDPETEESPGGGSGGGCFVQSVSSEKRGAFFSIFSLIGLLGALFPRKFTPKKR